MGDEASSSRLPGFYPFLLATTVVNLLDPGSRFWRVALQCGSDRRHVLPQSQSAVCKFHLVLGTCGSVRQAHWKLLGRNFHRRPADHAFTRCLEVSDVMTATSMVKEHPLPPRSGSGGADECGDAMIAMLEDQLAAERQSRHETEAALRETRAAMIKHQQIGRMGDFRYNTRTQRVRGSLEFYKLFGFDPALGEIDLVTWTEKIHPDEHVRVVKTLFDTIAALEPIQFECRIRLGDETRCIRCEAELNHDHVGDPVYYGVLTDVTECRTGEEALRRAEAELATSLRLASMESSPVRSFTRSASRWHRLPAAPTPAGAGLLAGLTTRIAYWPRWGA
ncbi:MAG: hypothetical protein WDN69_06160 [Aliidongia sp.]